MKNILLLIILSVLSANFVKANHIVGGEMTYEHINANSYLLNFKLYLDCQGNEGALNMDRMISLAVFDGHTKEIISPLSRNFDIWLKAKIDLKKSDYLCAALKPRSCSFMYEFQETFTLPPLKGGYYIVFQRCCRSTDISNISHRPSQGGTYWVHIPDRSTVGLNSSPVFNAIPPNYICRGIEFSFDHSAYDKDGDSLVYELTTPYVGGNNYSNSGIKPNPWAISRPPYYRITWKAPYSENNQIIGMDSTTGLRINRRTGLLKVTPKYSGQYTVGIAVKEYRNGVLIGEVIRDFEFNVGFCTFNVAASFSTSKKNCDFNVKVFNHSVGTSNFSWDFGDSNSTNDVFTSFEPTYQYSTPGVYTISLVVSDSTCADTFRKVVELKESPKLDLGPDTVICKGDTINLQSNVPSLWNFWNNEKYSRKLNVHVQGKYWLEIRTLDGCLSRDTVHVGFFNIGRIPIEDTSFCGKVEHILSPGRHFVSYLWQDGSSKSFFKANEPGRYWVRVKSIHGCTETDSVTLRLNPPPTVYLGKDTLVCLSTKLELSVVDDLHCYWSTGSEESSVMAEDTGLYWVRVTDIFGCENRDSIRISRSPDLFSSNFFMPNAFTPNDDGVNDLFPKNKYQDIGSDYQLMVFDRWGETLFLSSNPKDNWDGRYNGEVVPKGVYFTKVKWLGCDNVARDSYSTLTVLY